MKRTLPVIFLPALLVLLPVPPVHAQLKPAAAPTATRAVHLPAPSRPRAADNDTAAAGARQQDPLQSPALRREPAAGPGPRPKPLARPVYDGKGRVLQGMQPAGPDRVLDVRTGRYHRTVPSGDGQRIVD